MYRLTYTTDAMTETIETTGATIAEYGNLSDYGNLTARFKAQDMAIAEAKLICKAAPVTVWNLARPDHCGTTYR